MGGAPLLHLFTDLLNEVLLLVLDEVDLGVVGQEGELVDGAGLLEGAVEEADDLLPNIGHARQVLDDDGEIRDVSAPLPVVLLQLDHVVADVHQEDEVYREPDNPQKILLGRHLQLVAGQQLHKGLALGRRKPPPCLKTHPPPPRRRRSSRSCCGCP